MVQLLESIVNQILQAQTTQALEADYYERTDTRKVSEWTILILLSPDRISL